MDKSRLLPSSKAEYYCASRSDDGGLDGFLLGKPAPYDATDDVGATMFSMFQEKWLSIEPTHRRRS